MSRQGLITILTGYTSPGTPHVGVAPLGKNGLSVCVRSIVYFEAAHRSLTYRQTYRLGMLNFFPMFHMWVGTIQEAWQSEIMRVMDKPRFGSRENLGVRLFHEKFQAEPSITQAQKADEIRLYDVLDQAVMPSSVSQTTQYVYNAQRSAGSDVNSHALLTETDYPDKSTGNPGTASSGPRPHRRAQPRRTPNQADVYHAEHWRRDH